MDALRLSALGGISASAPNPASAQQAKAQPGTASSSKAVQDLAQSLFLQAFQAANALPGTEPASASATGLAGALLSALASPALTGTATQAATPATTTPATAPAGAATGTGTSGLLATPPASALPATPALPTETATLQAAPTDSTGVDFALQTALRFGAGVGTQADLAPQIPNLATGLVRDAAAVPPQGNLQLHTGGSGLEAFAQPRAALPQAQNPYRAPAVPEASLGVDLLA